MTTHNTTEASMNIKIEVIANNDEYPIFVYDSNLGEMGAVRDIQEAFEVTDWTRRGDTVRIHVISQAG